MLDLRFIRENPDAVKKSLGDKGIDAGVIDEVLALDKGWREEKQKEEQLRAERNKFSLEISEAKKGQDWEKANGLIAQMKSVSGQVEQQAQATEKIYREIETILLNVPNLPDASVPIGSDESANVVVRTWGKPAKTSRDVLPHDEAGEKLDILDFKRGSKLSGSRFSILKAAAARLERALIYFMLEQHISRGYQETYPPYLVTGEVMTGTGQLPKFEIELYRCERDNLYLIPTAEVPLINMHRGEILKEEELPIKYCAWTPCFRREAGAYGKDVKGLIRQHQFDKVELVKFTTPETSFKELELLTADAEKVLQRLELPYRVRELCTGDLGFASAKTYDLEVWLPSQERWLEIASCSNCTDYQARRADIRYWKHGKPEFVHTLNGSGVAIGRTLLCIMENHQDKEGISIPKPLQDFMQTEKILFK